MLRRLCLPFAPTVAAFAHAPLPCTPALTSSVSQRVCATMATPLESRRHFAFQYGRDSDKCDHLRQLRISVEHDEDPTEAIVTATEVFHSTYALSTRQEAAKLYKAALEASRQKTCHALKEYIDDRKEMVSQLQTTIRTLKARPEDFNALRICLARQRRAALKLQVIVSKLANAPDPENPAECIRFSP
jgi:hypothetical protein